MPLKSLFNEYPIIHSFEIRLHSFATFIFSIFLCLSLCGLESFNNVTTRSEVHHVLQNSSFLLEGESLHNASVEKIQQNPGSKCHDDLRWLYTFLCFNIFLGSFPRMIWKYGEGGLVESLTKFPDISYLSEKFKMYHGKRMVHYLMETRGKHGFYYFKCLASELFTLVAAIYQVSLIMPIFCQKIGKYVFQTATHWNFAAWCCYAIGCTKDYSFCIGDSMETNKPDTVSLMGSYFDYLETWIYFGFLIILFVIMYGLLALVAKRIYSVFNPKVIGIGRPSYCKSITSNYLASDWFILNLLKINMDPGKFNFLVNVLATDLSKKRE